MNTSSEQMSTNTTKKSASTRRIPESRLVSRKTKLTELGNKIAEVDNTIEVDKTEIANLKKSKTSEYVIKAKEENLNFLLLQRKSLVARFEEENIILAEAISRNNSLI